ncbi:MAG: hypothetical protein EXR79_14155 [Myxococcales bacterium]|nr:hypothetical protein [Myxococcales bacterium]
MTLRLTWLLLRKDLVVAVRAPEVLGFMLLFALLCVVLFAFGFLRAGAAAAAQVPGVLWVTLLFSGTVGLLRLFAPEEEGGVLVQAQRTRRGALPLFLSKAALQLAFTGVVAAITLPAVLVFFDAELREPVVVLAALALGLFGQAVLGTLCAALLVHVRLREVMLPLLLYPLLAPVLLAGVQVTVLAQDDAGSDATTGWLVLMAAFDVAVAIVAPWLHEKVSRG